MTRQRETDLVRAGTIRSPFGEMSEAVFMNSAYTFATAEEAEGRFNRTLPGFTYSRYSNPNIQMLEERLKVLEGTEECIAVSSGMAAVSASLMCFLKPGDRVLASRVLFSSCSYIITQVLPRFGISTELVDGTSDEAWEQAFAKGPVTAVFVETPANPDLSLVDIAALAARCKRHGSVLIVDNVFAGPLGQRPAELGADVVVYSCTKHMDGQGRSIGGAVLCGREFYNQFLQPFCRHTGPGLSPFNAWLLFKSLETYAIRNDRHVANAEKAAAFLDAQPKVSRVLYPRLPSHPQYALAKRQMQNGGGLVSFDLGSKAAAFRCLNALKMISIANNLGDSRSIVCHPASTTHASIPEEKRAQLGASPGLIRFSAGLESPDDILADLERALKAV